MGLNYYSLSNSVGLTFHSSTLGTIVTQLLPYITTAAGILLLLYLLYGGLTLMLSQGDPKAVQMAQGKITGALTGFVIVFVAYWIVQIVARVLGLANVISIFS